MGRQQLFVLERGMKHATTFNHTRLRVPSRSTSLFATHPLAPSSSCAIRGATFEARPSTRSLSPKTSRDTRRSFSTSLGSWATAAWHTPLPKSVDTQNRLSTVSGHLQKALIRICESLGVLRSQVVSAQLREDRGKSRTSRITNDEGCADISRVLRALVWVILGVSGPTLLCGLQGSLKVRWSTRLLLRVWRLLTCISGVDTDLSRSLQLPDLGHIFFRSLPLLSPSMCVVQ